jgi:hypothetical protein
MTGAKNHETDVRDHIQMIESQVNAGNRDHLERTRWIWLKKRVNWMRNGALKWESVPMKRRLTE